MEFLKKIAKIIIKNVFRLSFMTKAKNTNTLILTILLYVAVILLYFLSAALLGLLLGDVIAWLSGLFGTIVGLYSTCGIVLSVLCYVGVME